MMSQRSRRTVPVLIAPLALVALLGLPIGSRGEEAAVTAIQNTVNLQLQITGGAKKGCTIQIRPGHPGCRFDPVHKKLEASERETAQVAPIAIVASSVAADRDCSFFITITEPGRSPRSFRRGVRLMPPADGQPLPVQNVRVYLSSPSVAIREDGATVGR